MAHRTALASVLFGTAIMMSAGTALALNPQPLPPGDKLPAVQHNLQTQEPPDPCLTGGQNSQMQSQAMHNGTHLSGGAQTMDSASPKLSCAHRLNPQPLPPG